MIKLIVVNQTESEKKFPFKREDIKRRCRQALQVLSAQRVRQKERLESSKELVLVFLDIKQMKKINSKFRSKNKPTDVLSFSSHDPQSLGELLFCLDVLKKQAKQQNHTLEAEFTYMFIHGVLHLLGYDHEFSKHEEKLMFSLQDKIFQRLNLK